jgi:hypothetical protein
MHNPDPPGYGTVRCRLKREKRQRTVLWCAAFIILIGLILLAVLDLGKSIT